MVWNKYSLRQTALVVMTTVFLGSCGHDDAQQGGEGGAVPEAPIPIAFYAQEGQEEVVTRADEGTGCTDEGTYVTRADKGLNEVLPEGAKTFQVWGYKNMPNDELQTVMPGYTVRWIENSAATSTSNSHGWEYLDEIKEQTIKYWDWSATAYRFFGYADPIPYPEPTLTHEINGDIFKFSFIADGTNPDDCPYYSHLWFSNNNYPACPAYGQVVSLEFLKSLVKVRFLFISDDPDNMPIEDVDITKPAFKPSNDELIEQRGIITITYNLKGPAQKETCTLYDDPGTHDDDPTGILAFERHYYEVKRNIAGQPIDKDNHVIEIDEDILAGEKYWYTVLPATNQGTYTLTVNINNEDQTCVVPEAFMDWLPSYQYTYVFKVHADNGVSIGGVYSAFTPWTDGDTGKRIVFNW